MSIPDVSCREEHRLDDVRAADLFGLDYVEVSDNQLMLSVFFLGKAPQKFEKANLVLSGGRRIRDVQITDLRVQRLKDPTLDDYFEVTVNKPGDFSTYTLSVVDTDESGKPTGQPMQGFDSTYSQVQFSFKAGCTHPARLQATEPLSAPSANSARHQLSGEGLRKFPATDFGSPGAYHAGLERNSRARHRNHAG